MAHILGLIRRSLPKPFPSTVCTSSLISMLTAVATYHRYAWRSVGIGTKNCDWGKAGWEAMDGNATVVELMQVRGSRLCTMPLQQP